MLSHDQFDISFILSAPFIQILSKLNLSYTFSVYTTASTLIFISSFLIFYTAILNSLTHPILHRLSLFQNDTAM